MMNIMISSRRGTELKWSDQGSPIYVTVINRSPDIIKND